MLRLICVILFFSVCLNSFAQDKPQEPQDLYLAKRAFGDGFYEIALKHFRKYLASGPQASKGEVQIFISRCYLKLEKFAEALDALREILEQGSPEDGLTASATYWTAQTYFAAKDYESARSNFEKVIERCPESDFLSRSYYYRACCYYKRGQYNQALEFYRDFNKRFAKDELKEESSFHIAQCFYNVKDYSGAYKEFKSFLKDFPESAHKNSALYYSGEIEYIRGNFDKAAQYYTKAAEVQPKVKIAALAKYARGWAYLKLKEYKKALDEFNDLKEAPGLGPALEDSIIFAKGRCNAYLENYAESIRMYERIIEDFTHSSWLDDAYFWKGQALYELARYSEACQTYEQALEKFSKGIPSKTESKDLAVYERENLSESLLDNLRYSLGWTYARMKRYDQAIAQFEQVFEDSADRFLKSGALCRIGDIYLEQGKTREATKYYDSVLKDFSGSYYADYAQYQLGIALSGEKRFDSAILAFNALIANFPQSNFLDKAHYQIAVIYFRQGKFSQAREQLENLIKEFPRSQLKDQAAFLKACAYYNDKNYEQAKEGFRNALSLSTDAKLKMKALYQMGFCFYQMGKEEEAIKEFKRFLSLYPAAELSCDVLFWLGKYHFRHTKFAQAQEYFARLRQDFPHNELVDDASFWQAKALFNQQKPEAALDELQNLQTNYPASEIIVDAILLKGDIFKSQGRTRDAEDLYETICAKFKETNFERIAHKKRAEILLEQRLFPEAIEQYARALGSDSDDFNAQIQFAIAGCRQEQEDFPRALDEYLKVCYLYPDAFVWSRKARLECAQILERQAQWQKAKGIYEELAKEDNPEAELARKRLRELEKALPD